MGEITVMAKNDFKPFATGAGANVMSQSDWEALTALLTGFQSGKASSAQMNKAFRQASVMASVLAQFIADQSGNDVLDNGDSATILTNLIEALKANQAPQIPGKNRLINSRFAVNQRNYVSGTALALNAYGLDAWKASTANSSMTFAAAPYGAQTITIAGSFVQIIETQDIPTGTYTLSWKGTAKARVYNVGASAPNYASSPITVDIGGNTNVNVEFNAGTLFQPQIESGEVATDFEFKLYQADLAQCQRRCFAMVLRGTAGIFGGNSTYVALSIYAPVALRTIPTISLGGGAITIEQPGVNFASTTNATPGSGQFSNNVISFNINGNWSGSLQPGVPVTVTSAGALTIFSADL
jgi:hypothetical protein